MQVLREGSRVRLRRDVERYPHFIAKAGLEGVVTGYWPVPHDSVILEVQMDEHLPGAEEWENSIQWIEPDADPLDDLEIVADEADAGDVIEAALDAGSPEGASMFARIIEFNARSTAASLQSLLDGEIRAHEKTKAQLRLALDHIDKTEQRFAWLMGWDGPNGEGAPWAS